MEILYLSQQDIIDLAVDMNSYIDAVESGLKLKAMDKIDMPPKTEILPQGSDFIHAMPCAIKQGDYSAIKWISGYFENPLKHGLPALMGLIVLNDSRTGAPLAIMDCMEITKMRTAAVSGVALRHLTNPNSHTACILGCGNQGEANAGALYSVLPDISVLKIWNPTKSKAEHLQDGIQKKYGKEVKIAENIREAVLGSDIVISAGPGRRDDEIREIQASWINPGATVITVNHDANFVRGEVAKCADKIYVDDVAMYYWGRKDGLFDGIDYEPRELGSVLIGKDPGRENDEETIFSMPLGIGIDDLVCASMYYEKALREQKGIWLPM